MDGDGVRVKVRVRGWAQYLAVPPVVIRATVRVRARVRVRVLVKVRVRFRVRVGVRLEIRVRLRRVQTRPMEKLVQP